MAQSLFLKERFYKAAKSFLSDQTQLLHISYLERPFKKGDTIPLYHNFLYALILMENKEKETMQEGINLALHLLNYQIKEGLLAGAFPRYLHEYPNIERHYEVLDILAPLYWILHNFKGLFKEDYKKQLIDSIELALKFVINTKKNEQGSYLLKAQIASLLWSFGLILNKSSWVKKGKDELSELLALGPNKFWGSARHLSKLLIYFGLLPQKAQVHLKDFWAYCAKSWHPKLRVYFGAALNEHYYKNEQEPTLYHALMQNLFLNENFKLFKADEIELVLFQQKIPFDFSNPKREVPYSLKPFEVHQVQTDDYAYSYFNLSENLWEKRGGFYPFRLLLQSHSGLCHNFALHMGQYGEILNIDTNTVTFSFMKEAGKELDISFYGNHFDQVQVLCCSKKATMFNFEEPVIINYPNFSLQLKAIEKPDGLFGQLCLANRKSQLIKEFNQTYDWNFYLRTTRIKLSFSIKLELRILKNG